MVRKTVGTGGLQFFPDNPDRISVSFGNEGNTMFYLSKTLLAGLTADNAEYRLAPGDTMDLSVDVDSKEIRQPWSGISDAAGGIIRFSEMSEVS